MVEIPTPTAEQLGIFLAGVLLGLPAPYWYVQERIQGFIRSIFKRLPYEPPPGMKPDEAMESAVNKDPTDSEEKSEEQ